MLNRTPRPPMDHKIFDTLLEPVFILNYETQIIYCNETAATMANSTVRRLLRNKPKFFDVFHFDINIPYLSDLKQVTEPTSYIETHFKIENKQPTNNSTSNTNNNNTVEDLEVKTGKVQITTQPLQTNEWIVYFRDVTLEETLQKKYHKELNQKENVISELKQAKLELENYSKNLEKMVAERTEHIRNLNTTLSALLDSLGQAFFLFDKNSKCLNVHSKACEVLLESKPSEKMAYEVLKLKDNEKEGFNKWVTALFSNLLPFEDVKVLGPSEFPSSKDLNIKLDYYPIFENEELDKVVVVGTDVTEIVHLQKQAENERQSSLAILKLVENKKEFFQFLQTAFETLENFYNLTDLESWLRDLHTLKGGFSLFSMQKLTEICHIAEEKVKDLASHSKNILESMKPTLNLINSELELFIEKHQPILGDSRNFQGRWVELSASFIQTQFNKFIPDPNVRLKLEKEFLCEPIDSFIKPYDRVIQQVAELTNKQVLPLKISGGDLLVRPEPYLELFSTLVHAFRNSVDHGIESPELRWEKGKQMTGEIKTFISVTENNNLKLEIHDDGGGIAADKIREKLIQKGIDTTAESDEQVIQHVFDSELSTRDQISLTSGRGVGMDAILYAAKKINGTCWVTTKKDIGTILHIEVPYITDSFDKIEKEFLQKSEKLLPKKTA